MKSPKSRNSGPAVNAVTLFLSGEPGTPNAAPSATLPSAKLYEGSTTSNAARGAGERKKTGGRGAITGRGNASAADRIGSTARIRMADPVSQTFLIRPVLVVSSSGKLLRYEMIYFHAHLNGHFFLNTPHALLFQKQDTDMQSAHDGAAR